ncbi:MAG: hypothetical protein IKJ32_03320 [Clostridia bacterium]|nr:hypothetical protein [Clostridia bacterium]
MENIVSGIHYGTHQFADVFFESFDKLILFLILYFISFFITKRISKKTFIFNNILYSILIIIFLITTTIKAYVLSKLPPHDLLKDLCGLKFSLVQIILTYYIPIIYTIILFAQVIAGKMKKNETKK